MLNKRLLMSGAATLACVLGIGVFMQDSGAEATRQSSRPAEPQLPAEAGPVELVIENITFTSVPSAAAAGRTPEVPTVAQACGLAAAAEPAPGAMVRLSVAAPCRAGEALTVHHSGMVFSASLDQAGRYDAEIPALSEQAIFVIETPRGDGTTASTHVPGLDSVERFVLQWQQGAGFEMHARENGADYGSASHLWHGADAAQDGPARLLRLGSADQPGARLSEVYTRPAAGNADAGDTALTAEAEVTEANCGRDSFAEALRLQAGRLTSRDLVLSMPGCDAKGSFLVLNNLAENLKLAAN